jgi:hypothetical protein
VDVASRINNESDQIKCAFVAILTREKQWFFFLSFFRFFHAQKKKDSNSGY